MDSVGIAKPPPFSIMILSRIMKWFKIWKGALHQRSTCFPDLLPFGDASLKALRRDEEADDDVVMPVNSDPLNHRTFGNNVFGIFISKTSFSIISFLTFGNKERKKKLPFKIK